MGGYATGREVVKVKKLTENQTLRARIEELEQEVRALTNKVNRETSINDAQAALLGAIGKLYSLSSSNPAIVDKVREEHEALKRVSACVDVRVAELKDVNAKLWHLMRGICKDPSIDSPDHMQRDVMVDRLKTSPFVERY